MNIAITNGLTLMPPDFSAGLNVWSRGDGRPGQTTWDSAGNAALVPADQDFGTCLEIVKNQAVTRVRFTGETPMILGVYLRVSARVKAIAGPLCKVRIAGWAGDGARNHVNGLVETGPEKTLPGYGEVVEVSAIIAVGSRPGVDMPWGTQTVYGHLGLDLTGNDGGAIRIESIRIDDVTAAFVPSLIDWVDVRDFGAVGDGVTDDTLAFRAADAAAAGGGIVVPAGNFCIRQDLSISAPIRFKGKLSTPTNARIALMSSFDFPTYADAFDDETLGLKKALQALFGYTDHITLDLGGRRVDLTEPLLMDEVVPGLSGFANRRIIANGQIMAVDGPVWNSTRITSATTYSTNAPDRLTNVTNVAQIEVGSRVSGPGVGREVYVKARGIAGKWLTLSQPLYGGNGTRTLTFDRDRYVLDFSGVASLSRVTFNNVEFNLNGFASGVMLPLDGSTFEFVDCVMSRPKDRGITSVGRACQDLQVDRCKFLSNEMELPVQQRSSIAINVNANDIKIRDNRFVRFGHFLVANGGGHIITGNHWFQGDGTEGGVRSAGLVLTRPGNTTTINANYVDNAWIEWTNEHDPFPSLASADSTFSGLTIAGNNFLCSHTASWFSWLVIKPYGSNHYVHGLTVANNVFKSLYATIERIDRVDTTHADLVYANMRNVRFQGNTFSGINVYTANPLMVQHTQNMAAAVWTLPPIDGLPFRGFCNSIEAIVAETPITTGTGVRIAEMPYVEGLIGTSNRQARVNWKTACKGRVAIQARTDRAM